MLLNVPPYPEGTILIAHGALTDIGDANVTFAGKVSPSENVFNNCSPDAVYEETVIVSGSLTGNEAIKEKANIFLF